MKDHNKRDTRTNPEVMNVTKPYVLVEGPKWGDAEFYGRWLLAAGKAEALWKEAVNDNSFKRQIELVTAFYIPDFGIGATVLLSRFEKILPPSRSV